MAPIQTSQIYFTAIFPIPVQDTSAPTDSPSEPVPVLFIMLFADNTIKLTKLAGQGAWLSKANITDGFIVPIHPWTAVGPGVPGYYS